MKKVVSFLFMLVITALVIASPVFAQSADVDKVKTFGINVVETLVTLAGILAAGAFVVGGITYITSSGNPVNLDRAKNTIFFAIVGLVIVLGAFVILNIVTQVSTGSFGTGH